MRVSIAVPAGRELVNFNICVWELLRGIQRLVQSYRKEDENTPDSVKFTFDEEEGNKGVYEIRVTFFRDNMESGADPYFEYHPRFPEAKPVTPIKLEPPFGHTYVFAPPKGCNLEESAGHVYTEVVKLAYAMTQGRVVPYAQIAELPKNPSFTMVFTYSEEPDC